MRATTLVEEPEDPLLAVMPRRGGLPFLGQVAIVDELGRGGMAAVYLGFHTRLENWVAVKVRRPRDERDAKRFRAEAQALFALDSPHLVRVHDAGEVDGVLYITMEFVNGEDLRHRIVRRKRLAVEEAVALVLAAAEGVGVAHQRGIVHRDIKPGNVLVGSGGAVKVADLGIAKVVSSDKTGQTIEGVVMGTPGYMAPELYNSAKRATAAADVFALAATFAYLVCGYNVIAPDETEEEGIDFVEAGEKAAHFPDLAQEGVELPPALTELIAAATVAHPEARLANATEFARRMRDATVGMSLPSLADHQAARYSQAELDAFEKRARTAMAADEQRGSAGQEREAVPKTVVEPSRRRWASAALLVGAIGAGVAVYYPHWSLAQPRLQVTVDGKELVDGQPQLAFDEKSRVTVAALCSDPKTPCSWVRISGPEVLQGAVGPMVAITLPDLTRDDTLVLEARADAVGVLSRRVEILVRGKDDPPRITLLGKEPIDVRAGESGTCELQIDDDGDAAAVTLEAKAEDARLVATATRSAGNRYGLRLEWNGAMPTADCEVPVICTATDGAGHPRTERVRARVRGVSAVASPTCVLQVNPGGDLELLADESRTLGFLVQPSDAQVTPELSPQSIGFELKPIAGKNEYVLTAPASAGDVQATLKWKVQSKGDTTYKGETAIRVLGTAWAKDELKAPAEVAPGEPLQISCVVRGQDGRVIANVQCSCSLAGGPPLPGVSDGNGRVQFLLQAPSSEGTAKARLCIGRGLQSGRDITRDIEVRKPAAAPPAGSPAAGPVPEAPSPVTKKPDDNASGGGARQGAAGQAGQDPQAVPAAGKPIRYFLKLEETQQDGRDTQATCTAIAGALKAAQPQLVIVEKAEEADAFLVVYAEANTGDSNYDLFLRTESKTRTVLDRHIPMALNPSIASKGRTPKLSVQAVWGLLGERVTTGLQLNNGDSIKQRIPISR